MRIHNQLMQTDVGLASTADRPNRNTDTWLHADKEATHSVLRPSS